MRSFSKYGGPFRPPCYLVYNAQHPTQHPRSGIARLEEIDMAHEQQHYVNGNWVAPLEPTLLNVIDPSTEDAYTQIAVGGPRDVDRAVAAARAAFPSFARTSRKDRLDLLRAILSEYNKRRQDIAECLSREMGAPLAFALRAQSGTGTAHLTE
jgi:aldehyde dehydrogenase (NAD+)